MYILTSHTKPKVRYMYGYIQALVMPNGKQYRYKKKYESEGLSDVAGRRDELTGFGGQFDRLQWMEAQNKRGNRKGDGYTRHHHHQRWTR